MSPLYAQNGNGPRNWGWNWSRSLKINLNDYIYLPVTDSLVTEVISNIKWNALYMQSMLLNTKCDTACLGNFYQIILLICTLSLKRVEYILVFHDCDSFSSHFKLLLSYREMCLNIGNSHEEDSLSLT